MAFRTSRNKWLERLVSLKKTSLENRTLQQNIIKDFYLDDETCVPLGARIFGRYVITPNAAIEKPCMIPSVPVIHPFKNPGLLDQAFKGLLYFAKTPCELPGPKEPDLPPQQQNVGERENFVRVYPKGLESDQEQSTS